MKKYLIFLILLFFASPIWGATYYMRADGTASSGSPPTAPGPCSTVGNCLNVTNHNASTFSAGDTIIVCDDGGDFRATLATVTSGESGNEITYQAETGDTPVFSGFDLDNTGAGWTGPDGNGEYYKTYATEPLVVVADGTKLYTGTVGSLASDEWGYSSTEIYLGSNPTGYSSLEIGQRQVFNLNGHDYIIVDGITAEGSSDSGEGAGFNIRGGADHITIRNCTGRWNYGQGFKIRSSGGDNNSIEDNIAYGNRVGVTVHDCDATSGNENVVTRNTLYNNWHSGVWSSGSYVIIEYNKIYDNGVLDSNCSKYNGGSGLCDGSGITSFSSEGSDTIEGNYHTIRYNLIYNTKGDEADGSGILTDMWSDHNQIYGNFVFNNDGACVAVYLGQDTDVYDNSCYKNTVESTPGTNLAEIRMYDNGTDRTQNVVITNNRVYAAADADDYAVYIHSNLTNNAGISFDGNTWYKASGNWWYYGGDGAGSDLGTWNGKSLVGTDFNSDPDLFPASLPVIGGSQSLSIGSGGQTLTVQP